MKKLLTLGVVTLTLTWSNVMNQTQTILPNNGDNQSRQHALATNFPNRQPAWAQAALPLSNFDYNFESLVNNQTIFGQGQWVNAVVGNVFVRTGPGVNQTQTAKGDGGSAGTGATRPLDQAFYYTNKDTNVVWGVWGFVPSGGNNVTAIGGVSPCIFGPHQLGGITQLTTYLQRQSPLPYVTGDVLLHDHWYEYRVVVDFSVSGGSASLSYQDVTSGTAFKDDSVIKNVNLGLVPDSSGRYGFSEVYVRNDGAGYVDNLHFDAPVPLGSCVPPPSGLVSWWPGDGNGNDVRDGNNGTLINGATLSTGKVEQAFSLDGANDYVQLSNSAYNPFPATGFTYDFWINPSDTPSGRSRTIISNHHATGNWWNGVSLVKGTVEFVLQNAATGQTFRWQTSSTVKLNKWQLIAVTYQNQGNQATDAVIYFNGKAQALKTFAIGPAYNNGFTPGYSATDPLGFALGRLLEDTPKAYFRGLIDEGEFFNRRLHASEIQSIFNAGSAGKCKCTLPTTGLVSWWSAEGHANDIQDGNNGTLVNGATFAAGKLGQAFSFDGVNDGMSILKAGNLNMGPSDFSIEAWVNVAPTQMHHSVVFINYAGVPSYGLSITAAGKAEVGFRPSVPLLGGTGNDPALGVTGTTSLNDGQWHHLVGVRSGATVLIYVDGVLEGSATNPAVLTVNGGSVDTGSCQYARIGSIHTDMGHCSSLTPNSQETNFFRGLIDEVKIYNRALTGSEIQAIAGKCKVKKDKGMTWYHMASDAQYGTITVGCGQAPNGCDAKNGDTPCSQQLPVLCIYKPNPAFQKPVGLKIPNIYMEWSGGVVATTPPVAGNTFANSAAVTAYCQAQFGPGWRVAEFHDAVYWYFQAYGGTVSAPTVPSTRFWVHINDQPSANCWATP